MLDNSKIIAISSDHAGYELKCRVAEFLKSGGYEVLDIGTHSNDRVDYPDYGYALADAIVAGKAEQGIAICGSGIGISIALNRNPAVRAALCHDVTSARLARQHTDANVLALGSRLIGIEVALECVKVFLDTKAEGGRHAERVKKLGKV
ncbi:MAG: ribose 5-phosphate isomerase B [Alphaproteobacteria bacterium]|nr:ribose 5-phosphate isomerase B [Alphaproteobacteria bacterium]